MNEINRNNIKTDRNTFTDSTTQYAIPKIQTSTNSKFEHLTVSVTLSALQSAVKHEQTTETSKQADIYDHIVRLHAPLICSVTCNQL